MKKPKFPAPKANAVLKAIDRIATEHGIDITRWALRKWDKSVTERRKIEREKRALRARLAALNRRTTV